MKAAGAYHASGGWGQVVPVRLKPGTDVMEGILAVCRERGIRQGMVLVGIGSVRQLSYQVLTPKPDTPLGAGYTAPQVIPGPVEIVGLQGVLFQSEAGETLLHLHGTFSDREGKVYAGHVVSGANPVLATLDGLIAEVAGLRMVRRTEEAVGLGLFTPEAA